MRHEHPGIAFVTGDTGTALTNRGIPLAQDIIAGGEVTFPAEDAALVAARFDTLRPNAELRAINAVRAHARESITLGDAHWREIRCAVTFDATTPSHQPQPVGPASAGRFSNFSGDAEGQRASR